MALQHPQWSSLDSPLISFKGDLGLARGCASRCPWLATAQKRGEEASTNTGRVCMYVCTYVCMYVYIYIHTRSAVGALSRPFDISSLSPKYCAGKAVSPKELQSLSLPLREEGCQTSPSLAESRGLGRSRPRAFVWAFVRPSFCTSTSAMYSVIASGNAAPNAERNLDLHMGKWQAGMLHVQTAFMLL